MKWTTILSSLALAASVVNGAGLNPRLKGSFKKRAAIAELVNKLAERDGFAYQLDDDFEPKSIEAPKSNIWAELSVNETKAAFDFLQDKYNLTAVENATLYDNYVVWITHIRPNKTEALDFLEGDKSAPLRYARAVIFFGGEDFAKEDQPNGYWQTYQVGPLLADGKDIEILPMDWGYSNTMFPYHTGYRDDLRWSEEYAYYAVLFQTDMVKEITEDLVGVPAYGQDNSTMEVWATDPLMYDPETDTLLSWATIFIDNEWAAGDILPTGVFFKCNITGRDLSKYVVLQWVYNNIAYNSTEEFYEAWKSDDFVKLPKISPELDWTSPGRPENASTRVLDDKVAPITIEPQGRRWQYSEEDRYFTWMDWSFYISFSRDQGVLFYDIKFKGERIIYELGLQEAIAEYAGDDPFQTRTAYLDTSYGWGNNAYGLIPGYDCPANAVYFNSSWNSEGVNQFQNNTYCAYEAMEDFAMTRHTAREYVSVTKTPTFNIRFIATIGNYDYNYNYKFYLDGTMEVSVRAAGFIQGAYYNPETGDPFGYKIHEVLSGSFHDHVINFKADFDIAGTKNRVTNVALKPANKTFPWDPNTVYLSKVKERSVFEKEVSLNLADVGLLLVESAEQNNSWGNPRAYRVFGGLGHRIAEKAEKLGESANWANHDIHFTKQKDTEFTSTGVFNAQSLLDPQVNFDSFLDDESIDGEDVVCWFNLALHHLPNTQDVPGTIFTTAESNLVITPYNYFDSEMSCDTRNQFLYKDESKEYYDTQLKSTLFSIEEIDDDSFNFAGISKGKDTTNIPSA